MSVSIRRCRGWVLLELVACLVVLAILMDIGKRQQTWQIKQYSAHMQKVSSQRRDDFRWRFEHIIGQFVKEEGEVSNGAVFPICVTCEGNDLHQIAKTLLSTN